MKKLVSLVLFATVGCVLLYGYVRVRQVASARSRGLPGLVELGVLYDYERSRLDKSGFPVPLAHWSKATEIDFNKASFMMGAFLNKRDLEEASDYLLHSKYDGICSGPHGRWAVVRGGTRARYYDIDGNECDESGTRVSSGTSQGSGTSTPNAAQLASCIRLLNRLGGGASVSSAGGRVQFARVVSGWLMQRCLVEIDCDRTGYLYSDFRNFVPTEQNYDYDSDIRYHSMNAIPGTVGSDGKYKPLGPPPRSDGTWYTESP